MKDYNVTKEQVQIYENIRQSGVINMLDRRVGCQLSGGKLSPIDWVYITKNYEELIEAYGIGKNK